MNRISLKRGRRGLAVFAALGVAATAAVAGNTVTPASAVTPPAVGIVCETGPNFNITTDKGYINLPDGNTTFMYGYKIAGHPFQHPGPVLCVNENDTVTITLTNTLNKDVSMMFPGQQNVLANGAPAQPQFAGTVLTSLTNMATANGGSVTYSFVASNPGTFIYESGTDQDVQVRVGLFGALIVRPTTTPGTPGGAVVLDHANNRPDSLFTTMSNTNSYVRNDEEFLMLLSEVDPFLNQAVELGKAFNMNNYHPRYWLVNGRGFPDSIADNNAAWLPNQPYGSLARVKEKTFSSPGVAGGLHPNPGLVRYINVGTEDFPFHPHGNNGKVIARDGHPLEASPNGPDLSYEKFSLDIGPGQTWDVLFEWYDAEHYDKVTNPVPVTVPQVANQVFGMFYSGSPYLGDTTGELPPGSQSLNQCGEYYIIAHNHALYQITSWGVNMTGPITYMRIDPSDTTNCP